MKVSCNEVELFSYSEHNSELEAMVALRLMLGHVITKWPMWMQDLDGVLLEAGYLVMMGELG